MYNVENFEITFVPRIWLSSNPNNSKTTRNFEILKTQLNPACGDEQIVFLVFFEVLFRI